MTGGLNTSNACYHQAREGLIAVYFTGLFGFAINKVNSPLGSPFHTQTDWVSLTCGVRQRITPAEQAGSWEGNQPCRAHSVRWQPATAHTAGILPSQSFRGQEEKKNMKIILSGCWFSISHEFHPTITVLDRGGKGISCTSQMNFELPVYIGTDTSFRKASCPNWNKDKWQLQCTAAKELPASPDELSAFSSSFPMHKHPHSLMSLQHSPLKIQPVT